MKFHTTSLAGVLLLTPTFWSDSRGTFFEVFKEVDFKANGMPGHFPQDNMSTSRKGVLRGLHFQNAPFEQGKLVRCVKGSIYDVAVDLRPDSKTFGQFEGFELNDENRNAVYIPPGFAHGFQALCDDATILYKCTQIFSQAHDSGIHALDPEIGIPWPLPPSQFSEKDKLLPTLKEFKARTSK